MLPFFYSNAFFLTPLFLIFVSVYFNQTHLCIPFFNASPITSRLLSQPSSFTSYSASHLLLPACPNHASSSPHHPAAITIPIQPPSFSHLLQACNTQSFSNIITLFPPVLLQSLLVVSPLVQPQTPTTELLPTVTLSATKSEPISIFNHCCPLFTCTIQLAIPSTFTSVLLCDQNPHHQLHTFTLRCKHNQPPYLSIFKMLTPFRKSPNPPLPPYTTATLLPSLSAIQTTSFLAIVLLLQ